MNARVRDLLRSTLPVPLRNCEVSLITSAAWAPAVSAAIDSAVRDVRAAFFTVIQSPLSITPTEPDPWRSLVAASMRGVSCRFVRCAHQRSTFPAGSGIRAHLALARAGVDVRVWVGAPLLHAKVLILDDAVAFIGSANFCRSSCAGNEELSLMIEGPEAVAAVADWWEPLWEQASIIRYPGQ